MGVAGSGREWPGVAGSGPAEWPGVARRSGRERPGGVESDRLTVGLIGL